MMPWRQIIYGGGGKNSGVVKNIKRRKSLFISFSINQRFRFTVRQTEIFLSFMHCAIFSEFLSENDMEESGEENLAVGPQALVLKIVKVEVETAQHLLHCVGVSVVQRGVGGHARTYGIQLRIARIVFHYLVDVEFALRSVADERHVAPKNVPQLWKFIDVVASHPFAYLCEPGIVERAVEQQLRAVFLGVVSHAAELVDMKRLAVQPYALLAIDDRQSVLQAYCHAANEK